MKPLQFTFAALTGSPPIAVVWFALSAARRGSDTQESPEQTLKRRYTNGEIDREAYERML